MGMGKLTFFCGKMGAGKTTHARKFAQRENVVFLSEDEWLESLYPAKIGSVESYIKYSNRLKPIIRKLVQSILNTGTDVVMDFPANTISQRQWLKDIYSDIEASHELIYVNAPDSVCLEQIAKRRLEQPERSAMDTPEMFLQITRYFVEPTVDEGFSITTVAPKA